MKRVRLEIALLVGFCLIGLIGWLIYEYRPDPKTLDLEEQAEEVARLSAEELEVKQADPKWIAKGEEVYQYRCASCHGPQGEGRNGPNLVDAYWIHGDGSLKFLLEMILKGVPEKGMPPWNPNLPISDMEKAALFVYTLQGIQPEGAKAPQGEKRR